MTRTLTLGEAFEIFDRKNLACQIPNSRTGQMSAVSNGRRDILRTYMKAAVGRAAGLDPKDPALFAVDILPLVATLPELAHLDATEQNRTNPANEASGVRTFLRAVTADRIPQRAYKRRVRPESFLAGWRPLAEALWMSRSHQSRHFAKYAGWLETLQNILVLHGVRCPQDMPDYATVAAWIGEYVAAHMPKSERETRSKPTVQEAIEKRRSDCLTAYRKARELMGAPANLPCLERPRQARERGVQALPDLETRILRNAAVLRERGATVPDSLPPTSEMGTLAILDVLAPEIAKATRIYVEWTKGDAVRSESWRQQVVSAASNFVAELIRIGEDPLLLDYPDLFLETREIEQTTPAKSMGLKRGTKYTDREIVPLFRIVLDAAAKRSFAHSPLTLPAEQAAAPVPLYTPAVFNDFAAAWAVTERVYGTEARMSTQSPDEWREIKDVHRQLSEHMKEFNDSREMEGHKDKNLVTVNWGQAVCVGCFMLWRRARELRSAWHDALAKHGKPSAAPVVRARRTYCKALDEYVLWAMLLDDGLRIANYAGARMQRHIYVGVEVRNGERRIISVRTRFRGYDVEARTKKRRRAGGRQNIRARTLNPGIVDLELFTDFVYVSRVDSLVSAGLLAHPDAYDPAADEFALFVSSQSTRAHGGYLPSHLSKRFGRTLHWLARDVLNHKDPDGKPIPSWREIGRSSALRNKWRGIWNAHVVRQLIATFMVGVLKDEALACRLTNDTPATLASFYDQFDESMAELLKGPLGINHPEHFADVCRRLVRGEIVSWAAFDPDHPENAEWVSQHQALPAPQHVRSRRMRRKAA